FAIALLGAMALRVDHEHALAREPSAGEAFEPRAHVVGKARRAAHVEAKLDGARKLVDVLPAGARGADEVLLELALGDADGRGDADHRRPAARPMIGRFVSETPGTHATVTNAARAPDPPAFRAVWRDGRAILRQCSRSR